ncbi:hypothetical protein [Rhodopirellula sp. SWK7]|uniref:hypothetical protein n=1 Tax=Rhodopirellula sp. SWK7 TaxID=595460 RepID=UPI0002BFE2E2|nr:hypothetical protein [Rhodopirellula sp. SWK7]EMI46859.1 hypothetical protein RRSWK_00515 [Rhodopirellula sp. SWK7]
MSLSKKQISTLLGLIGSTEPDATDCDGCYSHLAEFAELELAGSEVPEAFEAIQRHLEQCPCCKNEFDVLIEGLKALQSEEE